MANPSSVINIHHFCGIIKTDPKVFFCSSGAATLATSVGVGSGLRCVSIYHICNIAPADADLCPPWVTACQPPNASVHRPLNAIIHHQYPTCYASGDNERELLSLYDEYEVCALYSSVLSQLFAIYTIKYKWQL